MYTAATTSPPRFQSEPSSAPCKQTNCGPTSMSKIADFYRDARYSIQGTRNLVTSQCGGTSTTQQQAMLDRRGAPASAWQWSPAQIRTAIATTRRPLGLWLVMGYIDVRVRIKAFTGKHVVTALGLARGTCPVHHVAENGIWVNDPNWAWPDGSTAPAPAKLFYPDCQWTKGSAAANRWVIAPDRVKAIVAVTATSTRSVYSHRIRAIRDALAVRSGPGRQYTVVGRINRLNGPYGTRWLEQRGGLYLVGTLRHTDWVSITWNGKVAWVARGFVTNV